MINSSYRAPLLYRNAHIHTIVPTLLRKVENVAYERERIATRDEDFLLLDWSRTGGSSLCIVSHGLEGHTRRAYIRGMVQALNQEGYDALAWNFRGCGGEVNRQFRLYHNGATDDLHAVVAHAAQYYRTIFLIGFSMGGNISLLYLGRQDFTIPAAVAAAVTFSVPCDLAAASIALERSENTIYMKRFLRLLRQKVEMKQAQFPDRINADNYDQLKTFSDFDGRYTAPIHGFSSAQDYWQKCSSRPWLHAIDRPTLIVNAADDPFLVDGCYPVDECAENRSLTLEIPRYGGHVGFVGKGINGRYWSEQRAVDFFDQIRPSQ